MPQDGTISTGHSGRAHRRAAIAVVSAIILLSAIAMPFQRVVLAETPWFMATFGALIVLTDGLTACLLIVQSGFAGMGRARTLGTAYLFSALIAIPHLLAFPGVFQPRAFFGAHDTPVYLWCFWHGGFAIGVLAFLFATERQSTPNQQFRAVSCTGLIVGALTLVATLGLPWLPPLLHNGNFQRLTSLGIGPGIILLCLFTTGAVIAKTQCRTPLSAWLMAGMSAATLDVLLTVFSSGRFTVGWYSARVLSLLTGVTVLFSLLAELMREASRVAEMNEQLERLLRTDVLTEVANRRAFESSLGSEWRRAVRVGTPLSLLMIDVDFFKKFNDRYGHPAGDECLRQVAHTLSAELKRPADLAARLGGEEFGLLLPLTDEAGAWYVAERVRDGVNRLAIPHAASSLGNVTISMGVATIWPTSCHKGPELLIARADAALYQAKAGGRDTIRTHAAVDDPVMAG